MLQSNWQIGMERCAAWKAVVPLSGEAKEAEIPPIPQELWNHYERSKSSELGN